MSLTRAQMEADIAFLLLRAGAAGTASFTSDRWTGVSSNALVALAYGGAQSEMPSDRGDYAACVRTYKRLPRHRKTEAVRAGLRLAREAYLSRCPEDRYPESRRVAREAWLARAEATRKASRRWRK